MPGSNHDDLRRRNLSAILRLVRAEVNRQLDYLAVALGGAINILNTQLVVLGGFLAALLAVDPKRLQDGVARVALPATFGTVRLAAAELGSGPLMIGAAELTFERMLDDPGGFFAARG